MAIVPQDVFRSTVERYARYRTGYPADAVAALAERLGLDSAATVVDVGCGTGQLAVPLARHAGTVIAIDPVPEMLAAGRRSAGEVDNIVWQLGEAGELGTLVPPDARAVTFAASFHWTDRSAVLETLDSRLPGGAAVVVVNSVLEDDEDPDWARTANEVRRRYLPEDSTATYRDAVASHRDVLGASAFSQIESTVWEWTRELTIAEAVGLQFTYSFSTPEQFGDRADAFAAEAHDAMLALHPDGRVTEAFRVEVLIATRPAW